MKLLGIILNSFGSMAFIVGAFWCVWAGFQPNPFKHILPISGAFGLSMALIYVGLLALQVHEARVMREKNGPGPHRIRGCGD